MSSMPPPAPQAVLMPSPVDAGLPHSVAVASYRTAHERALYLRALGHGRGSRLVVVLAVRDGDRVSPADLPTGVRLILTAGAAAADPNGTVGWYVPDPFRAVVLGMTGLQPDDGLILLFPADWAGRSPEDLVEDARRWRSSPHRATDDVYFTPH